MPRATRGVGAACESSPHPMDRTYALLDCNALNYLVRPPAGMRLQPRIAVPELLRHVRGGTLRVLATPYVLSQVSATIQKDATKTSAMLGLLRDLSDGLVLMDRPERITLERTAARRLETADVLCPWRHAEQLWTGIDDRLAWDAEVHDTLRQERATGERSAEWFHKTMVSVRAKLGGKGSATAKTWAWYERTPHLVDDWCRDFTRRSTWGKALARDGRGWPDPADVPSMWNYVAYHLSYIVLVNTRTIQPNAGDRGDVALYSEAAYADVLVTHDTDMRRIIANIRGTKARVKSIQQFVRDLGR